MKIKQLLTLCLLLLTIASAYAQAKVKVACVGNSITEGYGLTTTYPAALQQLFGDTHEVRNFGVSGRTLLKKGDQPYWNEARYREALAWNPDVVVIKLGTNDTKPQNWQHKEDFVKDYRELIKSFKKLPSKPKVYVCYPIPAFETKWGITDSIVTAEVIPALDKIARKSKAGKINLYQPFVGKSSLTYDGIHPNEEGAALLAREVYKAILPVR